jgi:hypothetical protein
LEIIVTSLALLACPVGMGAMMWFMMRGMKQPARPADEPGKLAAMRAEQQHLEAEVRRLRAADEGAAATR